MAVALIVAAGSGERLGASRPKAFVTLAGKPMVEWSVEALRATPEVGEIVVALPGGAAAPEGTVGVPGGAVRSASVRTPRGPTITSSSTTPPGRSSRPISSSARWPPWEAPTERSRPRR